MNDYKHDTRQEGQTGASGDESPAGSAAAQEKEGCRLCAGLREKDASLHSLAAQISYYSSLIQSRKDWEYAGVYADEGLSGTRASRPEFQRLLQDCRAGKIDMVLVKAISRFARNTVTMLETVRELKGLGIDVYFEKENIHSMSGDGELMLTILASFAQAEAQSVSENCRLGAFGRNFEAGNPGQQQTLRVPDEKKGNSTLFRRRPRSSGRYSPCTWTDGSHGYCRAAERTRGARTGGWKVGFLGDCSTS